MYHRLSTHQHGELARDNIAPHHYFGLDSARPDNLRYIEPGKVMYASGNTLVVLEISTMKRRLIFGLDGRGVGCFAVHPSGTFVAVGEKGAMPNIYVYEYPSFKIAKVRCSSAYSDLRVNLISEEACQWNTHSFHCARKGLEISLQCLQAYSNGSCLCRNRTFAGRVF